MASVEDATQTTQTQQPSWHVQAVQAGPHGLPPLTALDDDIPTSLPPQESLLPASYLQSHASPIKTTVKGSDEAEDAGIIDANGAGEGGGGLLPSPTSQSEVVNLPAFEHATPSAITVIAVATAASAEGSTSPSRTNPADSSASQAPLPLPRSRATWATCQNDSTGHVPSVRSPSPPMFPTSSTDAEAEEDELEATVSEVEVSRSWQEGEEGPYVESPDSSSPRAQARSVMSCHARPVTQLAPNMTHPSQTTSPQKRKAQPITSFSPRTLRAAGRAAGSVEPPDFTQRTRGFSRTISAPVSNLDPERDSFGDESNDVKRLKPRQRLELLTTGPSAKRTLSRSSKMHDKAYSGDTVLPAQNSEPYFLAASHQDRTNDIAVGIVHPEAAEHQGERLQVEDAIREEDEVQNPSGQINREELLDHDEDVMVSQISKSLGGEEEEVGQDSTPILQPTYINSGLPARSSQVPSDPPDQTLTSSQDRDQRHITDSTPRRYIISDDESEMEDRSILFTLTPRTTDQAIARPAASPSHPPIINGHFGNLPSSGAPSERFPSQIFDGSINGFGFDDESPREVQMAATQAVLQPTYSTQRSSDTVNAAPSHALPSPKVASKPVEPGSASTAASRASNIPANRQLTRRSRPPTEPAISEISMKVHTVRRQTETSLPQQVPRSAPLPTTSRLGLEPTQVSPPATVPLAPHVDEPRHNIASGEVNGGNPADGQPQTATVDGVDTPGPPGQTTVAVPSLSASEKPVDHAPPTQVVAQNGVISGVETAAVLAHVRESPTPTEVEPSSSRPSTPSPRDRRHPNHVAPNGLAEATYQNTFRSLPPPPPSSRPTPTKQYGKRKLPSAGERRKDQVQPLLPVFIEAVETIENEESEGASASPKVYMSKVTEESTAGNPTTACEPDAFNNIEHLEQPPPSSPIPVPRPPKRRSRPSVRAQEAMEDMEMLSDVSSGSTPPPPEDYTYHPTPKNGRKGKKANGQGKSKAASSPPSDVSEEESEDSTVDEESTPLRPAKKRKLTGTNSAKLQRVSKSAFGKAIAEEETLDSELSPTTEEDSEDNTYRPVKRKGGSRPKRGPQPPVLPPESTEVAGPVKNNKPNAPKGKSKAKPKTARNIAQRAKSKSVTTNNAEAGPSRGRSAASTELSAPPTMTSADTFTSLPVLAYWHGAQRYWFAGTAVGFDARSGMIRVDYADKTEADVAIDHLRLLRFSKGDQIQSDARSFPDRNFTVRVDWTNNIAGVEIVQETGVPSNRISLPDLYVRDKIVRRDWQDRIVSPEDLGLPNTIHLATSATKKSNSLAGKCFLLTVSGTGSATIRREMEKSIKERGGHIVNDWPALFELPDDGFGSTLATDDAPFLIVHGNELAKPKMVAALASGIPCLASSFVEDVSQGADWRDYLASPGLSVRHDLYTCQRIDESWGEPDWDSATARSRRQLFTGKRFLFVIPNGTTDKLVVIGALVPFCLHALGAASMDKIHKFEGHRDFSNYDYLLIEDREIKVKVPQNWMKTHKVCNFIWLKQCIINGLVLRPELMREVNKKD